MVFLNMSRKVTHSCSLPENFGRSNVGNLRAWVGATVVVVVALVALVDDVDEDDDTGNVALMP